MTLRSSSLAGEERPVAFVFIMAPYLPLTTFSFRFRHAWISYLVDAPPTADKLMQTGHRNWELPEHRPNLTLSRAAFKTYST